MVRHWSSHCAAALISVALTTPLVAQDYPSAPVRVIVGYPAGTGADVTARVVGNRMATILKQQFVVENRAGAGSSLGAAAVAKAPKDGYTLFLGSIANTINAAMMSNLTFDFRKDFAPIALLTSAPQLLVVHPGSKITSLRELIELAKAKPDSVTFGSAGGTGSAGHLTVELFKSEAGVKVIHVPYPGSPQLFNDVVTGRIQAAVAPASTLLPHAREGKIVALASTEAKRLSVAPDIPTMIEAGMPGFEVGLWFGLLAPAGTPSGIVDTLSKAANEALKHDDVKKAMAPLGYELIGGTPESFRRHIDKESDRWAAVVNAAGLKQ